MTAFPKLQARIVANHGKLTLTTCKIVTSRVGNFLVVSHEYGVAYYGKFIGPVFEPAATCTEEVLAEFASVEAGNEPSEVGASLGLSMPNLVKLVRTAGVRLKLAHCKVVITQSGELCVVNHIFGEGYYGKFQGDNFIPNKKCNQSMLDELLKVEKDGLSAVLAISQLCGWCCVCGRTLTNEDSIAAGIGPICSGRVTTVFKTTLELL